MLAKPIFRCVDDLDSDTIFTPCAGVLITFSSKVAGKTGLIPFGLLD